MLREAAITAGHEPPADIEDEQLGIWSEERIRQHFTAADAHAQVSTAQETAAGCQPSPRPGSQLGLQALSQAATAATEWFPGLRLSRTEVSCPEAVVIAMHNAGSAEDLFTSEGTGVRRSTSPLLEACRAGAWLLLAPQLPGRALRSRQPPLRSLRELATQLVPLLAPAVARAGGRYALVGHSMGAWAAYEVALAMMDNGVLCVSTSVHSVPFFAHN